MAKPRKRHKTRDRMPPWLRPRLTRSQVTDLGIVHATNVDEVVTGRATEQTLWDMVMCALTWSHVAELRGVGVPEISPQLTLVASLVERYGRTGVVSFEGDEYELAKVGIQVMDQLAAEVDVATAEKAVAWANSRTDQWHAAMKGSLQVAEQPRKNNYLFCSGAVDAIPLASDRRFYLVTAP